MISDIDAVENGVLLKVDLHGQLGDGVIALLKVCSLSSYLGFLLYVMVFRHQIMDYGPLTYQDYILILYLTQIIPSHFTS